MAISDWSTTASSNGNSDSNINWQEGQAPSTVNDSARSMMSRLKHWWNQLGGNITSGGSSNAYTLTSGESLTAYSTGMRFLWKPNAAPTGAATMNVDSIGAKKLFMPDGSQVLSGELDANSFYDIVYDASLDTAAGGFQIIGFEGESLTETHLLASNNLSDLDNAATAQTNLGYTAADVLSKLLTVDGAGSSLDADTLDGVQGSGFAQLSGATFTGAVAIDNENFTITGTIANGNDRELLIRKNRSGATIVAGDDVGTIRFQGYDGASYADAAAILADTTTATGNFGGKLAFQTNGSNALVLDENQDATFSGSVHGSVPISSESSGTLTSASANKQVVLSGNPTLPAGVFDAGTFVFLDTGGAARTITRGSGASMYVDGTDSATATLASYGSCLAYYRTTSLIKLLGQVS